MNKSTIGRIVARGATVASQVAPGLAERTLAQLFTTPQRRRVSEREARWMSGVTRSAVRFDDRRDLAVYEWGEGPTVLLVHGWSSRASQLALYVAPLLERGFRVVAFDAPSHGDSDGRRSNLPELATAVQRVAEARGPITAILAHSLGTAATTLALSRGVDARRVVYLAPPEDLPRYLARLAARIGFGEDIAPRAQRRLERHFDLPFEQARGGHLAPSLRVPLLVFHDERDHEVPVDEGRNLVARWPGARLRTTHGLGHNRIVRDPAVVEEALAFLAAA